MPSDHNWEGPVLQADDTRKYSYYANEDRFLRKKKGTTIYIYIYI